MEEQQTSSRPDPIDSSQQTERRALRVPAWGELDTLRPVLDRLLCSFCTAAQSSNGAAQSPGMAVQPAQTETALKIPLSTVDDNISNLS